MRSSKFTLQLACSTVALICAGLANPAWAQTQSVDQSAAAQPDSTDDRAAREGEQEIVVTGSNISGVKPVGNIATVITSEDAVKSGYSSPAEVLRTLPQVRPAGFDEDGGRSTISLQNAAGSNTVSLRGLGGSNATLILIDGRRTVQIGTNYIGTEANQLPLAALDRIEVIADGASAVYGSDAVSGVINYIVRRNLNGGEVTVRGNNNAGSAEYGVDATLGKTWDGGLGHGNILVSYSYTHRDPSIAGKNPYLRWDGRSVGGVDRRLVNDAATAGLIPNIVVNTNALNTALPNAGTYVYYGLPEGANVGLTAGQLRVNNPNLVDYADYTDNVGKLERHQLAVYANQQLGESLELFFQGNYLNRKTITRSPEGVAQTMSVLLRQNLRNAAGAVTANPNPFYISGIPGVAPGADLTVQYPILRDFGRRVYEGSDESYNLTGGLRADLPGGWKGEASYTYGRNTGCGYCLVNGYINTAALQYQIDIGAINPLTGVALSPAQTATFTGRQTQYGHNALDDAIVKFNGPLFDLPGGTVRAAVGGEWLKQSNYNENTSVAGVNNAVTVLTNKANSLYQRTIWSAFAEANVPLVSEEMNVPFVQSLTASAAVRYDHYSDSGETTNPKFGVTWEISDMLALSATWGTSYVAPSMTDKNPGAYVSGQLYPAFPQAVVDPRFQLCIVPGFCLPFAQNVAAIYGSNPNLRPQHSENWTLSAAFTPGGGFHANVNYYNISYKDRIVFPTTILEFLNGPTPGTNPPTYRGYERYILPINNPATCVNTDLATADPVLQAFLNRPIYGASSGVGSLAGFPNFCSIRVLIDSRFINLGSTKTDGMDIDVGWSGTLGDVALQANASANVIFNNKEILAPGTPAVQRLNTQNTPVRWRGRGSIGATYRGFSTTLFGNYIGGISNSEYRTSPLAPAMTVKVPAYTTFDLNLGYTTKFEGRDAGMLKGLRGSITILNLFDRDPQLVVNGFGSTIAGRSPSWGRTVSFQLTGSF